MTKTLAEWIVDWNGNKRCFKIKIKNTRDSEIIFSKTTMNLPHSTFGNYWYLDAEYTLVQETVDFMTAVNSKKKIKPAGDKHYDEIYYWLNNICIDLEMINGKWLIEED